MNHLIRQMGYVIIQCPDPEACAVDLSRIIGPRVTRRESGLVMLSCNDRLCEVAYRPGPSGGARVIGLEAMGAACLAEARRRVAERNLPVLSDRPSLPGVDGGFRFDTGCGPILEVHLPIERSQARTYPGAAARPIRLDHVNCKLRNPGGFADLLTGILGLRVSDRTADSSAVWLRAWDGYHHTVAVGASTEDRLHHYGFAVPAVDDLVTVADGLDLSGRDLLWGPGRHGAGDNVFTYYLDPCGCVVEASYGMARIENDDAYQIPDWRHERPGRMRNRWGSASSDSYFAAGLQYLPASEETE